MNEIVNLLTKKVFLEFFNVCQVLHWVLEYDGG